VFKTLLYTHKYKLSKKVDPDSYHFILLQIPSEVSPEWAALMINFILFLVLLSGSFFAAASEVAFFSITKLEAQQLLDEGNSAGEKIKWLVDRPKHLIATILITNNFVNISAILVASYSIKTAVGLLQLTKTEFHIWGFHFEIESILDLLVISSFLLLFGEIIPKVYASRHKMKMAIAFHGILYRLTKILMPAANLLISVSQVIDKRFQPKQENASIEDLKDAIDLMPENEHTQQNDKELLKGILNFSNISVKSVMISRTNMCAIEYESSFEEVVAIINEHGFSRMPVYINDLDHIKGILHIKDLLPLLEANEKQPNWQQYIRQPYFVPEHKKIDNLLDDFKDRRFHLAVVVDEFGGTSGMVTLEDIADEVFGEINDEFDEENELFTPLGEGVYIFQGKIQLNDVVKILDLEEDVFDEVKGNSDSLAGLVLALHGKIPKTGEVIYYQHFEFHIENAIRNKITLVKVKMKKKEEN